MNFPGPANEMEISERRDASFESMGGDLLRVIFWLEKQMRPRTAAAVAGKALVEGLAHDLKNPLAVIHSCWQFLQEEKKLTAQGKENLQWIGENIEKANQLIARFLNFARLGLTFQAIQMNELIRREWEIAHLLEGGHAVCFYPRLADDLPEFFGDDEKISFVVLHLFRNALQAIAEVSRVGEVRAETRFLPAGNVLEVDIADNGPGIPAKIRQKIFRPYFTTKRDADGLGLHLCRHFIQQHNGRIFVDPEYENGTKITLQLPTVISPNGG